MKKPISLTWKAALIPLTLVVAGFTRGPVNDLDLLLSPPQDPGMTAKAPKINKPRYIAEAALTPKVENAPVPSHQDTLPKEPLQPKGYVVYESDRPQAPVAVIPSKEEQEKPVLQKAYEAVSNALSGRPAQAESTPQPIKPRDQLLVKTGDLLTPAPGGNAQQRH